MGPAGSALPAAYQRARFIDDLCQRWHQPPSVILNERAADVLKMVAMFNILPPGGENVRGGSAPDISDDPMDELADYQEPLDE